MSGKQKIAVYDLDRTITVNGTYTPFLIRAALLRAPWRLLGLPLVGLGMIFYGLKLVDRRRLKSWMIALLLGNIRRAEMSVLADGFYPWLIRHGQIRQGALEQIAADRADGCKLIIATASFDFYAEALGRALGFDLVVATKSAWDSNGTLRAAVEGPNCYGTDKLAMLQASLGAGLWDTIFYSDHHSDVPCFRWAKTAVAVNPTPKLAQQATVLSLRIVDWSETACERI